MQAAMVAKKLSDNNLSEWWPASVSSFFLGDFLAFSMPVAFLVLDDRTLTRRLLLGFIPGLLSIGVALAVVYLLLGFAVGIAVENESFWIRDVTVNSDWVPNPPLNATMRLDILTCWMNGFAPCAWLAVLSVVLLYLRKQEILLSGFEISGEALSGFLRFGFILSFLQHNAGLVPYFEKYCPFLIMQPLITSSTNSQYFTICDATGLSVGASIALSLSGILPFVFVLGTLYKSEMIAAGNTLGFNDERGNSALVLVGSLSSLMVVFESASSMGPRDTVMIIAFGVCGGYALGGHLAFSSQYQPPLVLPLLAGKVIGAIFGLLLAKVTTAPLAERLELEEELAQQQEEEPEDNDNNAGVSIRFVSENLYVPAREFLPSVSGRSLLFTRKAPVKFNNVLDTQGSSPDATPDVSIAVARPEKKTVSQPGSQTLQRLFEEPLLTNPERFTENEP